MAVYGNMRKAVAHRPYPARTRPPAVPPLHDRGHIRGPSARTSPRRRASKIVEITKERRMATALIDGDPRRIGDYWLAGRLGAGGQGIVYEAYAEDGRRVAIKVLHGDPADDPDLRDRFGREATAARRVASFCTAAVLAAELDGPRPYIVSEYIE